MHKCLVLGVNGFIGRHLVEKLTNDKYFVLGYDINTPENMKNSECIQFIKGNFCEEKELTSILSENQIDTIYHLVSTSVPREEPGDIQKEITDNLIPTVRLLESMVKAKTKRIVFASSGGTVYGQSHGRPHLITDEINPICSYGAQKATIETYLKLYSNIYGIECRIARISNPYGMLALSGRIQGIIPIFLSRLIKGEGIVLFGETVRDYIHIDDVINALVLLGVYTGEKRIFNIGSGQPVYLRQLVKLLEQISGLNFTKIDEMPIRTCDVIENVLDVEETITELNWVPKISLKNGIERTLNEMKNDLKLFLEVV